MKSGREQRRNRERDEKERRNGKYKVQRASASRTWNSVLVVDAYRQREPRVSGCAASKMRKTNIQPSDFWLSLLTIPHTLYALRRLCLLLLSLAGQAGLSITAQSLVC